MASGNVLLTGASTGIGAAAALRLDQIGFRVLAGVRNAADGDALRSKASDRLMPVLLDVTDPAAIARAVGVLAEGPLAGLVNNAGIVVGGPVELVPLSEWRRQFEVNLFGAVAVTQAFLPALRAGKGRIVNVGSIGGVSALPYGGPYCASKFALEGLTDSLRMELRGFGIHVSIIEPGGVQTPIWKKSMGGATELMSGAPPGLLDLYRDAIAGMLAASEAAARHSMPPEGVVPFIEHALTASKPRTRYLVGSDARLRSKLKHLPDRVMDSLILGQISKAGARSRATNGSASRP